MAPLHAAQRWQLLTGSCSVWFAMGSLSKDPWPQDLASPLVCWPPLPSPPTRSCYSLPKLLLQAAAAAAAAAAGGAGGGRKIPIGPCETGETTPCDGGRGV